MLLFQGRYSILYTASPVGPVGMVCGCSASKIMIDLSRDECRGALLPLGHGLLLQRLILLVPHAHMLALVPH